MWKRIIAFLFLKKNLMKIFFFFFEFGKLEFFKGIENFGFFLKELKILIDDFFFF